MAAKKSTRERFFKRVELVPFTTCWLWTGYCDSQGYGTMHMNIPCGKHKCGPVRAHRVSWMIHFGDIRDGIQVLHRCDVTSCVNPDHLFLGNNDDNMRDKAEKGRAARGEGNAKSKLTVNDIKRIRSVDPSWSNAKRIALELGVTPENVSMVMLRKTWKHI